MAQFLELSQRHLVQLEVRLDCNLTGGVEMPLEDRLQLAYTAAINQLARQNATLQNLRNRTMALLTVAALATSFSTGVGLINTSHSNGNIFPEWAAYLLLGLVVVIGTLCVYVLWPLKKFHYGPSATFVLRHIESGETIDVLGKALTEIMINGSKENDTGIDRRMKAFQFGAMFLVAEAGVLALAFVVK